MSFFRKSFAIFQLWLKTRLFIFDMYFRELAFFYPDFVAPTVIQKRKKKRLQRTLALIRPDALRTRRGTVGQSRKYPYSPLKGFLV